MLEKLLRNDNSTEAKALAMTKRDLDKNPMLCSAKHRHYVREFIIAHAETCLENC